MVASEQDYGKPNPNAPKELSQFAFLIGRWRGEAIVKGEDGAPQSFQVTWVGRYILDGYAIADEFRMADAQGNLVMLGQNYRSYNTEKKTWVMKWQEALTSTWLDLGPEELGGVTANNAFIAFKARFRPDEIHRITFSNISEDHFTWRAEASTGEQKTWTEVMVIEVSRVTD